MPPEVNPRTLDAVRQAVELAGRPAVEARFQLTGIKRYLGYRYDASDPAPILVLAEFNAMRHGTFGKATPSGGINMSVANPAAAALLDRAHLDALEGRGECPVFRCWLVLEEPGEGE